MCWTIRSKSSCAEGRARYCLESIILISRTVGLALEVKYIVRHLARAGISLILLTVAVRTLELVLFAVADVRAWFYIVQTSFDVALLNWTAWPVNDQPLFVLNLSSNWALLNSRSI